MNDDLEVSPNPVNNKKKQTLLTRPSENRRSPRLFPSSKNTPSSNSANLNTLKRLSLNSKQSDASSSSKKIRKPSGRCESFGEKLQYNVNGYGCQSTPRTPKPKANSTLTNNQYVYNYNSMNTIQSQQRHVQSNHQSLREKYEYYKKQCGKVDSHAPNQKKNDPLTHEKSLCHSNSPVQNKISLLSHEKLCSGWQEASIRKTKLTHQGDLLCRPANGMSESFEIVLPRNFAKGKSKDQNICSVINRQCPMKLLCIPDATQKSGPGIASYNRTQREVSNKHGDCSKEIPSSNVTNNVFIDKFSSTKNISTKSSLGGNQQVNQIIDSGKMAVPKRHINIASVDDDHNSLSARSSRQEDRGFDQLKHPNPKLRKLTKRVFNPNISNNSAKCSIDTKQKSATPSRFTGKIVHVEGDGRCLFRSLSVCVAPILQTARRDEYGRLVREKYHEIELHAADRLRCLLVEYMEKNIKTYKSLDKYVLNADQVSCRFSNIQERLAEMAKPRTYAGEIEINAVASVIRRPILVLNSDLYFINVYGEDLFPNTKACVLRYTRISSDCGHYDAVILTQSVVGKDLARKRRLEDETIEKQLRPSLALPKPLLKKGQSLISGNHFPIRQTE